MQDLFRELGQEIGADPLRYAAEVVQSFLLLYLLWRLGRKPLRQRLEARRARIVAELAEADAAVRDIPLIEEKTRAQAARAGEEGPALMREAAAKAGEARETALRTIETEATEILAQATQAVARERDRVARETASRLVRLTVVATRRYLDEMLTESDRRSLTQKAILASLAELQETPPDPGAP